MLSSGAAVWPQLNDGTYISFMLLTLYLDHLDFRTWQPQKNFIFGVAFDCGLNAAYYWIFEKIKCNKNILFLQNTILTNILKKWSASPRLSTAQHGCSWHRQPDHLANTQCDGWHCFGRDPQHMTWRHRDCTTSLTNKRHLTSLFLSSVQKGRTLS